MVLPVAQNHPSRGRRVALVAALVLATAAAQPLSCKPSAYLGCFNDSAPRPVTFLALASSPTLTVEACATACAADGFPTLAVTGHRGASPSAFCYCGVSPNPASIPASDGACDVPCPGSPSSPGCGGVGASAAWSIACDGPLPPRAPGIDGPALPGGRACSQAAARAWPFCDAARPVEERVADLVLRVAVTEIGPLLTARASPPLPRLGLPAFMWGTNALHGITNYAPCRPSGVCPSSWPSGVAMTATWNATALRQMGATTGRELRAYDNLMWEAAAISGAGTLGGLTAWGPTINIIRE